MMARQKILTVVEPVEGITATKDTKFEKPAAKGAVKLVTSVDELVKLLHEEAKAI